MRRPVRGNGTFVHALLRHLEAVGFDGAPRFRGLDEDGREILAYIDGDPGATSTVERAIGDAQLVLAARLLRRFHDATAGTRLAGGHEVACHRDWTPANTVFVAGSPIALIDFEWALPGRRIEDIGYGAFHLLDLGYPQHTAPEQRRRVRLLADAYGLPGIDGGAVAREACRQLRLAAAILDRNGETDFAAWAVKCARWTDEYVAGPLGTGHPPN